MSQESLNLSDVPTGDTLSLLALYQIDVTAPEYVEVVTKRGVVWVNVNGVCVFRACRVKTIKVRQE